MTFGKAEVYWPQDDAASSQYQKLLGIDSDPEIPHEASLKPTFEAGVNLDAGLDVIIQPQANMGVKVGGGKLIAGKTIMDAQLSGYVTSRLSFQASASADTTSKEFHYSYGVYLFYNLGYTAKATILGIVDWALGDRLAYTPDQRVDIYGPVE